jgi:hypothetical protein
VDQRFPDLVTTVTDPQSNLIATLDVIRGGDGGASAVLVELRNPPQDHDVVLRVNTERSAFIMLTATDRQGTVLSTPARKFDSSEHQRSDTVRIAGGSAHKWRVPIAAQLPTDEIPKEGVAGRLVVNIALLFAKVSGDQQPADADFETSMLTLYDMDVVFTLTALEEGVQLATTDP